MKKSDTLILMGLGLAAVMMLSADKKKGGQPRSEVEAEPTDPVAAAAAEAVRKAEIKRKHRAL